MEAAFFVPSDQTSGIDILESLLKRYPVMLTEDAISDGESNTTQLTSQAEIRATEIVDLDQWIVGKVNPDNQMADEIDRQVDAAEPEAATEEEPPFTLTQEATVSWTQFQRWQKQLAFTFG